MKFEIKTFDFVATFLMMCIDILWIRQHLESDTWDTKHQRRESITQKHETHCGINARISSFVRLLFSLKRIEMEKVSSTFFCIFELTLHLKRLFLGIRFECSCALNASIILEIERKNENVYFCSYWEFFFWAKENKF